MKVATVIRADAVTDGDTTLDGKPISAVIEEQEEHVRLRAARPDSPENEVVGSAPETVTLKVGRESKVVSPSDLIVVLR